MLIVYISFQQLPRVELTELGINMRVLFRKQFYSWKEIKQAGVTDIVAALYERKPGEVWPVSEIKARAKKVRDAGMIWSVVMLSPTLSTSFAFISSMVLHS